MINSKNCFHSEEITSGTNKALSNAQKQSPIKCVLLAMVIDELQTEDFYGGSLFC